ncbi:MAG: hypothetical protein M1405_00165 [Patescibacteria group bacterium]|nr:hypothetical protein [Patescibacteria group bacterium]
MKKVLSLLFLCIFLFIASFVIVPKSSSDQLDDITKQINDLTSALNMSINATRPLQSQLDSLKSQIQDIKNRVAAIEQGVAAKEKSIDQRYKDLARQQEIFNQAVRRYYIDSYKDSPLIPFLSGSSVEDITRVLGYQQAVENQNKATIYNLATLIETLEIDKKALEDEKTKLTAAKSNLDEQSAKLDKIVTGARAYQANLSTQIAELSATQQQLLAQKYGSLGISLNSYSMLGGCKSDILPGAPDPGFSPKIGFFTYGVPNRVGLNQFGALGRAKAGQDYNQILQAYYNFDSISDVSQSTQIHVSGNGIDWTGSLEDYMKRIYEVPDSWTDNNLAALKAQAVAARSYVLAYTNNGSGSICPTDQCQVFKTDPKGGNWEQAVNATAGKAMVQGGSPIKAWFSSTHGGYVFSSSDIGWSGTSFTKRAQDASGPINSFSDLQNNAYDKASPWFYCDWGSRGGTAWLRQEEVADIANVMLLVQADSGTKEHLYQTDKSNPAGTDTWSSDRVKQELRNRNISPFNFVSSASVDADFGVGKVTTVHINGDAGSASFSGDFFKTYFNIRAPGNINIVGPLYNVEQR